VRQVGHLLNLKVIPRCLKLAAFAQICPGILISVKIGGKYPPKYVCIVDSYMYTINDTNGMYCCVSTPRMVTRTRHNITFHIHCLQDTLNCSFPVVLYGRESWSRTLREEHRLRVFENRVLRRIFGPKRDEVTGEWRRLHNEELYDLYCSSNVAR